MSHLYGIFNTTTKEGRIFTSLADLASYVGRSRMTLYRLLNGVNRYEYGDNVIIVEEIARNYGKQRNGRRNADNLIHIEKGTKKNE